MVYEGSPVVITCVSSSRVMWKRGGVRLINYVFDETIKFIQVHEEDSGEYVCEGTYPNGKSFTATAELLVARKFVISIIV